ncbi:hypothetical protein Tco_0105211, partial [Tanacetum coccineum]
LTLDSARSYVMQGASFTQGTIPSIPIGGSISSKGFLLPILLLVVIIVTVVIVAVILVVVVVVIVGVVIVVAIIRIVVVVMIIGVVVVVGGWAYAFHQDKASSVRVPVANVTLSFSEHLLRENTDSVRSNQRMSPTAPSVPLNVPIGIVGICHGSSLCFDSRYSTLLYSNPNADPDRMPLTKGKGQKPTPFGRHSIHIREIHNVVEEQIRFLGGNSSSGTKKYRGSNSNDGGNTGDGVKIAGGVIGSGDEIVSSKELKKLLYDEAEKLIDETEV